MIRVMLLLAVLLMLATQYASASEVVKPGEYITSGGWGEMKISKAADGSLKFEISAIGGNAHTCGLNGKIVGGRAVLEGSGEDKPCIVTFRVEGKGVQVSDNDACSNYYCGARASFTGLYLKPLPVCESMSVMQARKEFKRLYDMKSYRKAFRALEPVFRNCADMTLWSELGLIRNDLAITQYKMGDYTGCLKTLKPLEADARLSEEALRENYAPADADTIIPIAKAARTNLELCRKGKGAKP